MKPGDLVVLKDREHYVGLDVAAKRYFTVPGGSIGVFLGRFGFPSVEPQLDDDRILTHGRVLLCGQGIWSVADETR
jgi:hypothetical protein